MAQLGARFHGMEEVIGSIPIRSTNQFNHLAAPPFRDTDLTCFGQWQGWLAMLLGTTVISPSPVVNIWLFQTSEILPAN